MKWTFNAMNMNEKWLNDSICIPKDVTFWKDGCECKEIKLSYLYEAAIMKIERRKCQ